MKRSTAYKFNKIAKIYNSPIFQFYYFFAHKSCINFLKDYIKDNFRVLDVACGTGIFLEKMNKEKNGLQLFGIDNSEEMISIANQHHNKIDFKVADAEKIPFENNSFDLITIIDAFYYFQNKETVLRECSRVLKPNHYLFIFYIAIDIFPKFILKLIQVVSKLLFFNSEEYSTFPKIDELENIVRVANLELVTKKIKIIPGFTFLDRFILLKKV